MKYLLLFFFIFGLVYPADSQEIWLSDAKSRTNLLFYLHEESEDKDSFTRFFPFYSYKRHSSLVQDELSFWPFFASYELSKNPIPTILPYSGNFQWSTAAFLSLGSSRIEPAQAKEVSTMVSFLLMTYSQETYIKDKYLCRSWYSLPLLSYYHSESLMKDNTIISNTEFGNPFFSLNDIRIQSQNLYYPVFQWAFNPFSLVLGEDSFKIAYQGRWGKDHQWELFSWDCFSLFSISTTFDQYPGSQYHRFSQFEMNTEKGLQDLFASRLSSPTTRMGILSPFIVWQTNPSGTFSCQVLPLFYYHRDGDDSVWKFLLLGLETGSKGFRFAPDFSKLFPFYYHDPSCGRWDVLWPLFYYQENPVLPGYKMKFRFIFDYHTFTNSQGKSYGHLTLLEGFLLAYNSQETRSQIEIFPGGFIFGYYEYETELQWRFLGCGYEDNPQQESIQLFFIKIPIRYKRTK